MHDQAENLRQLVEKSELNEAKVIAVVSGKGGVGKSNIALNFAITLAKHGKRVAIFDLDIGMGNVDILMGKPSDHHIMKVINERRSIWDLLEKGPESISYLAGGTSFSKFVELSDEDLRYFFSQIEQLYYHFDYIFLDIGAGASKLNVNFVLAAHDVLLVTTPEPTSLTDAYAMMKYIHLQDKEKPFYLIANRTETMKESTMVLNSFTNVASRFLHKNIKVLGAIPFDQAIIKAVKAQTPFVIFDEKSKATKAMNEIVTFYTGENMKQSTKRGHFITRMKQLFLNRGKG